MTNDLEDRGQDENSFPSLCQTLTKADVEEMENTVFHQSIQQ